MVRKTHKRYYGVPISKTRALRQRRALRRELKQVEKELEAIRKFPPVSRLPEAVIGVDHMDKKEEPETKVTKSTGQTWEDFESDLRQRAQRRRSDRAKALQGAGDITFSV